MLTAVSLTRRAARRLLLDGISFEIPLGSTATLVGPSGSGKTTLLRAIQGLERLDAGELHLDGRCLARQGLHVEPAQRDISLVFQEFTLFPHLDVAANLAFGLKRGQAHRTRIADLLELFEIGHLEHRRIANLSGGEQQRVALARALAVRPRVLLLDEPFSNVDSLLRERLYRRLKKHLAEEGTTTLIATHDYQEAFYFSDTILVLRGGEMLDWGPPRRIYEQPADAWVAAFFGPISTLTGTELLALAPGLDLVADRPYLVRPEAFELVPVDAAPVTATLEEIVYYGAYQDIGLRLDGGRCLRIRETGAVALVAGGRVGVRLRAGVLPHALPDLDNGND